jgi:dolichol-phosphate mannosyltransferase
VFHLAAHGAYSWQADLEQMIETNIGGTVNLVRAFLASGGEAFVNSGSSSEYGYKRWAPPETEWLEPNSHYAVTKAAATLFCRYEAQDSGLRVVTLRLYSAYGPYEDPRRLIPSLVTRGLRGELPPLVNPDVARDFVYTDDVCDAFLLAASHPTCPPDAVYNVGSGVQTSLRELINVARRVLPFEAEPEWGTMEERHWDTTVWVADNRRIRADLGWQPRVDLEAGLRRTADWFREEPARLAGYERVGSG